MSDAKKIPGRERQPTANAARSLLNTIKVPDNKSSLKDPKAKDIIDKVVKCFNDNAKYDKEVANASVTATIEQIRTLLNQLAEDAIQPALEEIKDEVSSTSLKSIIGNVIMSQLSSLFDGDAKKEDVEDLKMWMKDTFSGSLPESESEPLTDELLQKSLDDAFKKADDATKPTDDTGQIEEEEDNVEGDYQDSTPAKNFATLQDFVNTQFDDLNKKLKNIPGQSGILSRISASIGSGFSKVLGGVGKLTKGVMGGIGAIAKKTLGVFSIVGTVAGGIKKLGSKIGGAIASPFKKVGGFLKSLNPFKSSEEKAAKRKESAKEKIFNFMAKVLDKIWKAIEPFIDKVAFFMGLITKFVIIPIAIIMAKILLVVGAIIAIGVAAYLAYKWVKDNISSIWNYIKSGKIFKDIWNGLKKWYSMLLKFYVKIYKWIWDKLCEFGNWLYDKFINPYIVEPIKNAWNYISSGQMFDDIVDGLKKMWDWLVDFGKWIWDKLCDFGKWIWDKLCEFGNWLYDKFINPYIVEPFEKAWNYISSGEIIDDMIDGISKAWEWIKDIGKTITDAVVKWWEGTTIYQTWQEIKNCGGLWEYIKKKFNEWWDSMLKLGERIKKWWNESTIGKWVNGLAEKINVLKQKLGQVVLKVPFFGFVRPFGPAAGLPFKLSDSEADDYEKFGKVQEKLNKNIEKAKDKNIKVDKEIAELEARIKSGDYKPEGSWIGKTKSDLEKELQEKRQERFENDAEIILAKDELKKNQAQQAKQLAQQQVSDAMKPIDSINKMNVDANNQLGQQGQEMSQKMKEKEETQEKKDAQNDQMLAKIYQKQVETDENVTKQGKNPTVLPMPYQTNTNHNAATMQPMYHSFMTY